MKPYTESLINGMILILLSGWGYLASESPSPTALIPAAFGVALLACYSGLKSETKVVAHAAAGLTLVVLVALIMPLRGTIARGDFAAVSRVVVMMVFTAIALVTMVRSFIEARRNRT